MIIEYYSHVMHIVSNVEGILDEKYNSIDALISGFPAGTVSGAPKIRAMEIIEELENENRSFYGGAMGYFDSNGQMDTCISLRTGLVKNNKLFVQAGGGVVYDSDPEKVKDAIKFNELSFDEAYERNLKIMDMTAFTLCKENNLPIIVFDMNKPGNLIKLVEGEKVGTLIY